MLNAVFSVLFLIATLADCQIYSASQTSNAPSVDIKDTFLAGYICACEQVLLCQVVMIQVINVHRQVPREYCNSSRDFNTAT